MANNLKQSYINYAVAVRSKLQPTRSDYAIPPRVPVLPNRKLQLRTYVENLEIIPEFNLLVEETCAAFSSGHHGKSVSSWHHAVKNVFRRSDFYGTIYDRGKLDLEVEFEKYCETFSRTDAHVLYLAPIEFVYFAEEVLDFGRFQIKRFTEEELTSVFGNNVNAIFYPWATIDISKIRHYWFICFSETVQAPRIGFIHIDWSEIGRVSFQYTSLPKPFEPVVKQLVLYDWQADYWNGGYRSQKTEGDLEEGWQGFNLSFVLRVYDCLYESPHPSPSFDSLRNEPMFDSQTGEEIGERPEILIHFSEEETASFKIYISSLGEMLSRLNFENNEWHFFEIALGTLTKAFFADGLDQLLWHITVIEALFGEKGEELTEKLARRIASVLGNSKSEKKALKKRFKRLYAFRSDLVHGNRFEKEVYWGHLREARDFARKTLIWFLNFLSKIQDEISNQSTLEIPKREVILALLDMNEKQRNQLKSLVQMLPPDFPHKKDWIQ